jgi:F-type H+-transporting ATPase subunit delta
MDRSNIAKSYARALLAIANESNNADLFESELREISTSLSSDSTVWEFLVSPRVKKPAKQDALKKAFQGKIQMNLLNALMILVKNDRIAFVPQITDVFGSLNDERKGVIRAEVQSAIKLGEKDLSDIKAWFLSEFKGKECVLKESIKPDLIGGMVLKYGDILLDRSIKRKMKDMKSYILEDMQTLLSKDKVGAYYEN